MSDKICKLIGYKNLEEISYSNFHVKEKKFGIIKIIDKRRKKYER